MSSGEETLQQLLEEPEVLERAPRVVAHPQARATLHLADVVDSLEQQAFDAVEGQRYRGRESRYSAPNDENACVALDGC